MGQVSHTAIPGPGAGNSGWEIVLSEGDTVVGRLRFRLCPVCHTGRIQDIWVNDDWQRRGLGREAMHTLLTASPGYRWTTTRQTWQGNAFFAAIAQETQTPLSAQGPLCLHLRGWWSRLAHRLVGHQ
ncbi:GNAT family N-acetyltransferase [Streptomyces griseorubiginosus]|uniref:GNAT family N-acetyltransferase n=1 Tax=Streptomyces griseorubiginosus TaxID=67304 RepID=UPI003675B0E5